MAKTKETVFVGMPFKKPATTDPVYRAIRQACEDAGLRAVRLDERPNSRAIVERVCKEILHARCCVFDLSDERPNVYYEIALADRILLDPDRIVFLASSETKVHADVQQRGYIAYSKGSELRARLRAALNSVPERDRFEIEPSGRTARELLDYCLRLSKKRNEFRKYIARGVLDRAALSLERLTDRREYRNPGKFANVVIDELGKTATFRVRAVCGSKTWPPPLVRRYYEANYELAGRENVRTAKHHCVVERVFIRSPRGMKREVRRAWKEHQRLADYGQHSIRCHVVDWSNLPDRDLIPGVYHDLVRKGFGFIAITEHAAHGVDRTTVYAHLGGGGGVPFLGARFDDPGIVAEMLGLFANLVMNRT